MLVTVGALGSFSYSPCGLSRCSSGGWLCCLSWSLSCAGNSRGFGSFSGSLSC